MMVVTADSMDDQSCSKSVQVGCSRSQDTRLSLVAVMVHPRLLLHIFCSKFSFLGTLLSSYGWSSSKSTSKSSGTLLAEYSTSEPISAALERSLMVDIALVYWADANALLRVEMGPLRQNWRSSLLKRASALRLAMVRVSRCQDILSRMEVSAI